MKKNSWFKHWNTASSGQSLRTLWDRGDMDAYGMVWMMFELISRWEDSEDDNARGKITVAWETLARETGWKRSKCRRVLARISSVSILELTEIPEGYVSFLVPNWLKFNESRGGKRDAKKEQKPDRGKRIEERGKRRDSEQRKHPLVEIWNRHRGGLPECKGCGGKRLKSAAARWDENPSTEYWSEIVSRMAKSDFCLGKKNKPGPHENWKARFDFLIQGDTQHKVLEGQYDDKRVNAVFTSTEESERAISESVGRAAS